jgi:hypothetical protein
MSSTLRRFLANFIGKQISRTAFVFHGPFRAEDAFGQVPLAINLSGSHTSTV